jgi:hypothetical protein
MAASMTRTLPTSPRELPTVDSAVSYPGPVIGSSAQQLVRRSPGRPGRRGTIMPVASRRCGKCLTVRRGQSQDAVSSGSCIADRRSPARRLVWHRARASRASPTGRKRAAPASPAQGSRGKQSRLGPNLRRAWPARRHAPMAVLPMLRARKAGNGWLLAEHRWPSAEVRRWEPPRSGRGNQMLTGRRP